MSLARGSMALTGVFAGVRLARSVSFPFGANFVESIGAWTPSDRGLGTRPRPDSSEASDDLP